MKLLATDFIFMIFFFTSSNAEICKNDAGDEYNGGACFLTSHTLTHPIDSNDTSWESEGDIKESITFTPTGFNIDLNLMPPRFGYRRN